LAGNPQEDPCCRTQIPSNKPGEASPRSLANHVRSVSDPCKDPKSHGREEQNAAAHTRRRNSGGGGTPQRT
jgi:hypothetical protein